MPKTLRAPRAPRALRVRVRRDHARSWVTAAADALAHGQTDEVRACARAAYHAIQHTAAPTTLVGELMRLEARAAFVDGDPHAALDAFAAALAVAELSDDVAAIALAQTGMGVVLVRSGQLDEAKRLYQRARNHAVQIGDRRIALATTLNLGIIANVRGDLRRARSYYQRALTVAQEIGATGDEIRALNNLGLLYADLAQWDRAERAYHDALTISVRIGNEQAQAELHANVAEVWLGRGDIARARAACAAGIAASDRDGQGSHRGELHKMTGVLAREAGALDEAEAEFTAAERIAHARQDLLLLAETAREQGDLYRRQGRNRDTLVALNSAHRLFRALRAQRDLADVDRRVGRLEAEFIDVARRWGESIEAADRYTQGHCERVADLACRIAAHAGPAHGFDPQALFWYRIGALLHDVGKLDIPSEVLNKAGKLTDTEFGMIRGHPETGVTLLGDLEFPWDIRPIVLSHHERWDGKGYPHRLAGDAIPLAARILAVADVYDALTSVRSYKRAMPHAEALRIIRRDAGTAFDPAVVEWFEAVAPAWCATRTAPVDSAADESAPAGRDLRDQRRAAGLDEATGLPGPQAFFTECGRVLAARAADGRPSTLVVLTFGTGSPDARDAVNDAALAAVADALSCNTRGGDFVGRYAEREFVVLMPDTTAEEGAASAAWLRDLVDTTMRRNVGDGAAPAVDVTSSTAPESGTTSNALLAATAAALRHTRRGASHATGRPA